MSADSDAFKTVQSLPALTAEDQQYMLAVARGEGFYGLGWGNPSAQTIAESASFGIDPRAGVGSNNWGAEQGTGSAGFFMHVDHHANGEPYQEKYKRHATPTEGAASVMRILLKPNVRAALATGIYQGKRLPAFTGQQIGKLRAAVYSQYENRYFELNPDKYFDAVKRNYDKLTQALQWSPLLLMVQEGRAAPTPLASGQVLESSPLQGSSSGESSALTLNGNLEELPEAGFVRGQKYSVPGIQDEKK